MRERERERERESSDLALCNMVICSLRGRVCALEIFAHEPYGLMPTTKRKYGNGNKSYNVYLPKTCNAFFFFRIRGNVKSKL